MQLFNADCLDILPTLSDNSIDMVLADPPYGTTACKWDSIIPLEPLWKELKRITKPNAAIVMTASQPFTTTLIASNMKMFKYCWVWVKTKPSNFLNCKKQPMRKTEDIIIFADKKATYNPQGLRIGRQNKNSGKENTYGKVKKVWTQEVTYTNYPHNILKYPNIVGNKAIHPTQKPVTLMEYLIKTYTNEGDTVLDFCMGSGSTGVACVNLGRDFIGIEKDTEHGYFDIAQDRIKQAQENKEMLLFKDSA